VFVLAIVAPSTLFHLVTLFSRSFGDMNSNSTFHDIRNMHPQCDKFVLCTMLIATFAILQLLLSLVIPVIARQVGNFADVGGIRKEISLYLERKHVITIFVYMISIATIIVIEMLTASEAVNMNDR